MKMKLELFGYKKSEVNFLLNEKEERIKMLENDLAFLKKQINTEVKSV